MSSFLNNQLSQPTAILGLKLWVLIGLCLGAALVVVVVVLVIIVSLYAFNRTTTNNSRRRRKYTDSTIIKNPPALIPTVSKEIAEIPVAVVGKSKERDRESRIESGEMEGMGWGQWYTLREMEECTGGFDDENVIGEGGYAVVYRGVLRDASHVAVKNLLNNRGQAEKEFKVEVEAIGRVRHKNLVRLLGYCAEGAHRILVYEYVDNGNLEHWLHGDVGPASPLTWDVRMNILVGTAKGLTYLHEGLEPKVVHRDIKSSNILLDKHWNAKVSDFGLAKLLGSELSYVTTRVMGTFGYVAPEYANTGRNPVDYSRPPGEVNLVDWIKLMVSTRNTEGIIDPKLSEKPPSRALKRVLLVALRCVDPNAQKRPKMGQVVHMLEAEEFPFRDDRRGSREHAYSDHSSSVRERLKERRAFESGDSSGYESGAPRSRLPLRKSETVEED
ncbi:hypothetical protein vseg_017941 [Gypsophila vaccaria]